MKSVILFVVPSLMAIANTQEVENRFASLSRIGNAVASQRATGLAVLPIVVVTAKTQHGSYPPSNLIDSNPNTFYHSYGTTAVQPWVQLELQPGSVVNEVKITNRVNCCGERLSDVEVRVGDEAVTKQNQQGLYSNKLCGKYDGPGKNGEVVRIECPEPIPGRYITIQIKDRSVQQMNIGEVEAFGTISVSNDNVCEARLVQGSLLKKTLEALEGLLDEAVWDWSSTGLQIQTIDRFHVSLVSVSLRANGFDKFKCNHDLHTGLDQQIMSNILRCAGDDDTITINAEDQGDKLTFIFESPNQKIIQHYEMKLWDSDSEQLGIPENDYLAVIKLPSNLFERIIKDLGQVAGSILIECFITGVIQFSSSDMSTSGKIKLTQTANVEKVEEAVTIDIWEPLSLTFAAEHLRLFAKASFLAPQVTLSMSSDAPLVVEYKVGGIGHIRYYLAPKMEEYDT